MVSEVVSIWKLSHGMTKPTKWSAQSDQSQRCPPEAKLGPKLPTERTAKSLIRLGGCPGWSESSLGTQVILLVLSWSGSKCFFLESTPAPIAQLVECPLRGTGGHGFDPGPRHTKVVKNATSCSSLGTQSYGVELGLVDPVSG